MDKAFKIAVVLSAYDRMSTVINSAVDKSQNKLKNFKAAFQEFGERSLIMGGIGSAFFRSTVTAAEESEVAEKRLRRVFTNMIGDRGNEATDRAAKFASAYQTIIGVEDEQISAVQSKIATFSAIIGTNGEKIDAFNRATKLSFDMAADGFGDAASNAVQLGKALQNPALGAGALSRAGAINKEDLPMVKRIQTTKGLAAAQEYVLKAVEKQVAGVAAATATAGQKSKIAWSEVEEQLGRSLLPTVNRFADFLTSDLIPKFSAFVDKNPVLVQWLAGLSIGFLALGTAATVLSFSFSAMSNVITLAGSAIKFFGGAVSTVSKFLVANPIILLITAIAVAAYLIYDNWGAISSWFKKMWSGVTAIFQKTWTWIKNLFINYTAAGLVFKHWDGIIKWFANLWSGVKNVFFNTWEGIKTIFLNYTPAGLIYSHWDEIVVYFTNVWQRVKDVFINAWASIKNGVRSFFGAGDADAVVRNYERSLQAVNQKTARAIAFDANTNVAVAGPGGSAALRLSPNHNNNTFHYAPVISYTGAGGAQDATALSGILKQDFNKQMKEYQSQLARKAF